MMLHTKYQGLALTVSEKKIFSCFPYISLCKTCDPWDRASIDPMCIIRTNLVDVQWFQAVPFETRRFFHVFPIKAYVKHVTSGA